MDDVDSNEIVSGLVVVSSRLTRALRRVIGDESDLVTLRGLGVVEQYQPVRVGHFAQGYLCSQPAATKVLARLEEAGYVLREASASDRRASQFSLTDAGRARLAENRNVLAERMEPYFEALTPEDRLSVHRALGLVSQYLQEQHPVDADEIQQDETQGG
ncbi:MarR family winged helix-turn-helix transcriptional regulator [Brevibacterium marinum]|uniref:DNA-binding MarR family transcriptional regulator n=1 Tax=Brevibacterium marinum TaxID=418643 RepID=A0A846S1G2_9MICO|nr:MarR family transcriptional regulator [Brevibacterium marinum]NJC56001.1 DNA-binding MarR family transcriptional regulator [Brevibacterium marinum]